MAGIIGRTGRNAIPHTGTQHLFHIELWLPNAENGLIFRQKLERSLMAQLPN